MDLAMFLELKMMVGYENAVMLFILHEYHEKFKDQDYWIDLNYFLRQYIPKMYSIFLNFDLEERNDILESCQELGEIIIKYNINNMPEFVKLTPEFFNLLDNM